MRFIDSKTSDSGFSMLELLIALFVLSIGLLGTASLTTTAIFSSRIAQNITVETNMARSALDEIFSRPSNDAVFDSVKNLIAYDLDTSTADWTRTVQGEVYSANYSITPDTPVAGLAEISVTVTSSHNRSATLTTIKDTI